MNLIDRIESNAFIKSIWDMKYRPSNEIEPSEQIEYICKELSSIYPGKKLIPIIESIEEMNIADPDVTYPHNYIYHYFLSLINDNKFLPGGRVIAGMGLRMLNIDRNLTLQNCYVIPIESDSIEGIYDFCKNTAVSYAWGGGVGTCISGLRPRNMEVNNASKSSTGSVSFLPLMDTTTATIGQNGRRGAFLAFQHCAHPDIEEFITCKKDGKLSNMNISVGISDDFMVAVKEDKDWDLWYPIKVIDDNDTRNYKIVNNIADCYKYNDQLFFYVQSDDSYRKKTIFKTVKAKYLWDLICQMAWEEGCPGVIFTDTIKSECPYEYTKYKVHAPNPCSELLLPEFGVCNLGSINLSEYVDNTAFNFEQFKKDVMLATFFLDCILEYSINNKMLPFEQQIEVAKELRILGLGITGLHDCLIKKNIEYGSQESFNFVHKIADEFESATIHASEIMGKILGVYPAYNKTKAEHEPRRNAQLTAIAPTGTISLIMGCSTGIEPVYAFEYEKKIRKTDEKGNEIWLPEIIKHPLYAELKDNPEFDKNIWIESQDLDYLSRVFMQSIWQEYIDSAISSTVNMKNDATVEDISKVYMEAWNKGCKGITIFRDGCLREGVLKKTNQVASVNYAPDSVILPAIKILDRSEVSILSGKTIKIPLEPSWYLTVNFTEHNIPVEVFINAGKSGSDVKASTEAFGRLISLYLQEGGSIERIIESLKGIHGREPCFKNGWIIQSQPDAIAKALEKILVDTEIFEKIRASKLETCPKCHQKTFMAVGGCGNCVNQECLFTNCG